MTVQELIDKLYELPENVRLFDVLSDQSTGEYIIDNIQVNLENDSIILS